MSNPRHLERFDARQWESLKLFHEVASALTSNLELNPLLRSIMAQMEDFFGPEQWSLLMLDDETGELFYALSAGVDESVTAGIRLRRGEGIAGHVARTGKPLVIPNVRTDPAWADYAARHPEVRLQSIACLPIRHGDRTLAVLQLHNSKLDLLPDSALSFLRVLCDYAAIALENARHVKLIHHLSITDECTGLYNARHLYTLLEQEIEASNSPSTGTDPAAPTPNDHFSLLFFDLDHFKSVNDTYGHLVGTRLLTEIGGVIKRALGPQHAGFRYGGDEFVALLRGLDKRDALAVAHQIRRDLTSTNFLTATGLSLRMTASFGLATFPEDGPGLQLIIRAADTMMYVSKADGRDTISVADADTTALSPQPKVSRHS